MINIHLVDNHLFINQFINRIEKFYPNKNLYLLNKKKYRENDFGKNHDRLLTFDFTQNEVVHYLRGIFKDFTDINIIVHYLKPEKAFLISQLRKDHHIKFKTYWIFYGSDLYTRLYKRGRYDLFDRQGSFLGFYFGKLKVLLHFRIYEYKTEKLIREFIKSLDHFCFWNHYDYELLKKHYITDAQHRKFIYGFTKLASDENPQAEEKKEVVCLVNHSASFTGNHKTILKALNQEPVKRSIGKLLVPLSYGPSQVRDEINDFCLKNYATCYFPILEFLDKVMYFKLLSSVDIAFFGHRRQEGAGNINLLIMYGAKVYLREENNLLQFYRDKGIKVFSFEKDLNLNEALTPLDIHSKENNRDIILEEFSEEKIDLWYKDVFRTSDLVES